MKFASTLAVLAVAVLAAGCQSTSIRSAWFDTSFKGPPMRKIVVAGSVNSVAEDRLVEEVFVERMRAVGVDAVAGHTLRLDDPNLSQADFEAAVKGTGAQGLLLVRVLGVDQRTQVSTTMVHGGMGWGHNSWGPHPNSWGGMHMRSSFPVQEIRQYDLATVETKLFDVNTRSLVWAVTTTTFNPRSVAQEAPPFANLIIEQLKGRDIIAVK